MAEESLEETEAGAVNRFLQWWRGSPLHWSCYSSSNWLSGTETHAVSASSALNGPITFRLNPNQLIVSCPGYFLLEQFLKGVAAHGQSRICPRHWWGWLKKNMSLWKPKIAINRILQQNFVATALCTPSVSTASQTWTRHGLDKNQCEFETLGA